MTTSSGRIALVTGASRGLGRGIALALAEHGINVVLNYHQTSEQAEQVAQEIRSIGSQAMVVQADVGSESDVQRMFQDIDRTFGRLDVLVNNAGTTRPEDIFSTSLESWDHILRTNLTSCFLCSREAMHRMKQQKQGRIINISSVVGHNGALRGHAHYAATKSGMLGLTKTLARTAAEFGVTVNCVAPGIIDTELLRQTHGDQGVASLSQTVPLGLGTPRDVGLAVAFLAGEGGRYITGATIDVNGGMYLR